ncbi:hypothetical protein [Sphingomonas lacusdianchii]|uniref:hypothetical protein n=1 Tax=Sphingomonas lacusdianchii TaxID=2917992 RepID=UPI001F5A631B|nr:hypothetical protein [Sphingomonas sp. JXJ CY 53]
MAAILIALDLFSPGAINQQGPVGFQRSLSKEADTDDLFLVLKPMLLWGNSPLGNLPEALWRHASLNQYFSEPGPTLGAPGFPAIIANKGLIQRAGWPSDKDWQTAGVPVPFPPGTSFDIELEIKTAAGLKSWRYQGAIPGFALGTDPLVGDPALAAPRALWPDIATSSFIRPRIEQFAALNEAQQSDVLDWLIAAIAALRQAPAANLTTYQARLKAQEIAPEPIFNAPDIDDQEEQVVAWRAHLSKSKGALAGRLYTLFIKPDREALDAKDKLRLDPPIFTYDSVNKPPIESIFPDIGGKPVREASYHHLLWRTLSEKVESGRVDDDQRVVEALRRLFGFGERLRWIKARRDQSPDRFMTVDADSDRLAGGFGTNMHSLAGQMFRLGGFGTDIQAVTIRRFLLNGADPIWDPTVDAGPTGDAAHQRAERAKLGGVIVAFSQQAEAAAADGFSVELALDTANPDGLVSFQPKLGELTKEPLLQGWEIPPGLLDAATAGTRIQSPVEAGSLVVAMPQRTGLRTTDLLGGTRLEVGDRHQGKLRVRVRVIRRARFGAGPPAGAPYIYDVAIAEPLASLERALVDRLAAGDTDARTLELWLPQKDGSTKVIALAGAVTGHLAKDGYPMPLFRVTADPVIADIDKAISNLPAVFTQTDPAGPSAGFALHLAIGNLRRDEPFNILPQTFGDRPLIGLTEVFTSRVGQSADRLWQRYAARYAVAGLPQPDPANPIHDQLLGFTKLRLALARGASWTMLTYPDALTPLQTPDDDAAADPVGNPLGAGPKPDPATAQQAFALVHHFEREIDEQGGSDGPLSPRTREALRYASVIDPKGAVTVGGYAEHQYSLRLSLAKAIATPLLLAHEVRNPADARADRVLDPGKAAQQRQTLHLLGFTADLDAATLTLDVSAEHVRALLNGVWNAETEQRDTVIDGYRALYELFAELDHALARGKVVFTAQVWHFDNRAVTGEASPFLDSMMCLMTGTLTLTAQHGLAQDLQKIIDALLAADFATFQTRIDAVCSGALALPAIRPVSLLDAAWTWSGTDPASPADPRELSSRAHLLRLGCRIERPSDHVVPESAARGRYLALPLSDGLKDRAFWQPAATATGYEGLAAAAKKELTLQLQAGSALFERFAWIACRDRFAKRAPDSREARFETALRLQFGEATPHLHVPISQMPQVNRVCDLYYTTYGFLPLVRQRSLPDPIVTLEYAFYLVELTQAILDGTAFERLELSDPVAAAAGEEMRRQVELLAAGPGGLADQITDLLLRVDDREEVMQFQKDPLYTRVDALIRRAENRDPADLDGPLPDGELRRALVRRFATRPADFARLRGLGLAIFDPDRYASDLYGLRINKRIREDLADQAGDLPRNDADEFSGFAILHQDDPKAPGNPVRFLIDALDEASYDAEFTIEQNRYVEKGKLVPDHTDPTLLGAERRVDASGQNYVTLRGDAQARTAEDVLEADLPGATWERRYLPDAAYDQWATDPVTGTKAKPRQLEANVVHYNPSWRVADAKGGRVVAWQYLLPSRRPPSQPAVLNPKAVLNKGQASDLDPRTSRIWPAEGEDPVASLFQKRARAALAARASVAVDLDGTEGAADALALTKPAGFEAVEKDLARLGGWHYLDRTLAHHYFLVDADPDASPAQPTQNDVLVIQTVQEDAVPASVVTTKAVTDLTQSKLYPWYWWDRMRHSGHGVPRPAVKPTAAEVVSELAQAFDYDIAAGQRANRPDNTLLNPAPAVDMSPDAVTFVPRSKGSEILRRGAAGGDALGQVVACEILLVEGEGVGTTPFRRYAVRVTTLESPFERRRVRLRVLRNFRDMDGDADNDIAEAFQMASPHSEWSELADGRLRLAARDFLAANVAQPAWVLAARPTRAQWAAIDIGLPDGDPARTLDFGPMLRSAIDAASLFATGPRYWSGDIATAKLKIFGIAIDGGRDAHVILKPDGDRAERLNRQILIGNSSSGAVSWADVDTLTAKLDRGRIVSSRFDLAFHWVDEAGKSVMELTLPVRFAPGPP